MRDLRQKEFGWLSRQPLIWRQLMLLQSKRLGAAVAFAAVLIRSTGAYAVCENITGRNIRTGYAYFREQAGADLAGALVFWGGSMGGIFTLASQDIGYLPASLLYDPSIQASIQDSDADAGATVEIAFVITWYGPSGSGCSGTPLGTDTRSVTANTTAVGGLGVLEKYYAPTELLFVDVGAAWIKNVITVKRDGVTVSSRDGCYRVLGSTGATGCNQ
jgi:hypothetical protein